MRKVSFFIGLCCLTYMCCAQQNQRRAIDSIYSLLQTHKIQDTGRVKLLNSYARSIRFDSVNKAMQFAEEGLVLARVLRNEPWIAQSLLTKSLMFSKQSNFHEAIRFCDSARNIFKKSNSPLLTNSLNVLAENYYSLGKFSEAIDVFHEVITVAEKKGNKRERGIAFGNIGNIYSGLDMTNEAIASYEKASEDFKALNDTMLIALAMQNVALCFNNLKQYQKAKEYYLSVIEFYRSLNRSDAEAMAKAGLGMVLGNLEEYPQSLSLLKESLIVEEKNKNKFMMAVNIIGTGNVIRHAADSIKDGNYSYLNALEYEQRGLQLAKEIGDIQQQSLALKFLYEIYERQGNYSKAFEAQNEYIIIKDSVSGSNKRQEIAIKEIQFENEKKEAVLLASHHAEVKRQTTVRNFSIAGAGLIILASMLVFISYKRRRDASFGQKEAELKAEITDTEMKALRAQMNPHFIFNSLNSISDYIAKSKTELADEYLTKFAKLMRLVLENSEKREVSLSEDLKALELYMQLEALRLNDKFTYIIKVDDIIDKENTMVPPLILQPFVENSIWHGIAKKQGDGNISIHIKKEGEMVNCIVEDNGIGRQANDDITELRDNSGKRSLGMRITKERINIINKVKNANAAVKLTDLVPGTRVEVWLPLELNF